MINRASILHFYQLLGLNLNVMLLPEIEKLPLIINSLLTGWLAIEDTSHFDDTCNSIGGSPLLCFQVGLSVDEPAHEPLQHDYIQVRCCRIIIIINSPSL